MYVLVGRDARDDSWSDFGGKVEKVDKDAMSTAAREFWEETYGVLMDAKTMRSRLTSASLELRGRTQNMHPYYCFVTEIPFVPGLRNAFRKQLAFLRQRNVHRTYLEKTDVVYVTLGELYSDAFPKRSVFKETLAAHKELLHGIALAGPSGFRSYCVPAGPTNSRPIPNGPPERDIGTPRWQ
jgi:hypothetical protein